MQLYSCINYEASAQNILAKYPEKTVAEAHEYANCLVEGVVCQDIPHGLVVLKEGLHKDVPDKVYHNLPAISSTQLIVAAEKTLAHFFAISPFNPDRIKKKDTPALRFGRASHKAMLEYHLFLNEYAIEPNPEDYPDRIETVPQMKAWAAQHAINLKGCTKKDDIIAAIKRQVDNHPPLWGDIMAQFERENGHKEKLNQTDGKTIMQMLGAFNQTIVETTDGQRFKLADAIKKASVEETFIWQDKETGIWLRCRTDIRLGSMILDYKTTMNAELDKFGFDAAKMCYDIRAAMYLEGVTLVTGRKHEKFTFVIQEKEQPFVTQCHRLKNQDIENAYMVYRILINQIKTCMEKGTWPAYGNQILEAELPSNILDRRMGEITTRRV